jgi:hypothetical protein
MCGPGLMALIALLTGDYKLSRRRAVSLLSDVLGIEISLGALSEVEGSVSEILEKPCDEAVQLAVAWFERRPNGSPFGPPHQPSSQVGAPRFNSFSGEFPCLVLGLRDGARHAPRMLPHSPVAPSRSQETSIGG